MRRVIVESPYKGDVVTNEAYLAAALADCLKRGEAPFASHWMYPGILDDSVPDQRRLGMEAGFAWLAVAEASVVYTNLGLTSGMLEGVTRARERGLPVEYRTLEGWG